MRLKLILTCTAMLTAAVSLCAAQDTFPAAPPADLPAKSFMMPHTETRTLLNGLKVIVAETHQVPLVTMRLAITSPFYLEDAVTPPGIAAAAFSQLTAGAEKYTSLQLSEAADKLGGAISAAAGEDFATVTASALSENVAPMTALLAEVVLHPTFPQSELDIYKKLTVQGLTVQRQNPAFLAREATAKILYGDHPYGTVAPTPESVKSLTRDSLLAFYKDHLMPAGSVLIVVGDVKPESVFAAAMKEFGGWSGGSNPGNRTTAAPPVRDAQQIILVNRPGSVQSNIVIANLAIPRNSPDLYALTVANAILGGSSSARLFGEVRERLGYAYSVGSSADTRKSAGSFSESAQTRTDVTAPAITAMLKEADKIRTETIGDTELQNAKNYLNGSFALGLTSQAGLADRLLSVEMYGLPSDFIAAYRAKVNGISAADVQSAAQKYITPEKAAVVVVGNADKLRDSLKPLGTVEEKNP